MTKHDRLINALQEIKEICSKNDDEDRGCGRRCPFLMKAERDGFRDCEVLKFIRFSSTPEEWGEDGK